MSVIKISPVIFAIGEEYQISVPVSEACVMWVKVGGKCYYDESNGVLRSFTELHKMSVPAKVLDEVGEYTVCYRRIIERKPYFSELEDAIEERYVFRPVEGERVLTFNVADSHGMVNETVAAVKAFEQARGKLDFLILNGDVIDHSGDVKNFDAIYEICSLVTAGEIPVVFSRGNHDTRGIYAEKIADYTPTRDGFSYFTFRIGHVWGIVLDCGEDKADTNVEYGGTICCHEFRAKETEYLESVVKRAEEEYEAEGVTLRLVIAHSPFTRKFPHPFNIEEDIYGRWAELLRNYIKPNLMICGHMHRFSIDPVGGENDYLGQPCTVVVASQPKTSESYYAAGGFVLGKNEAEVLFTDSEGKVLEENTVKYK